MFGMGGMGGMGNSRRNNPQLRNIRLIMLFSFLILGVTLGRSSPLFLAIRYIYLAFIVGGFVYAGYRRRSKITASTSIPSSQQGSAPQAQAGWYPEGGSSTVQRYWDGSAWGLRRRWNGSHWTAE